MKLKVGDSVGKYQERNRETGQAVVEWAFVFPVFLLLFCAIIDFSWIGYQQLMFESSFQMSAWDFPLKLLDSSGGGLNDTDILLNNIASGYGTSSPGDVVEVDGGKYTLGEGIKKHMLQSSAGFLKDEELTVISASAVFRRVEVQDDYSAGGKTIRLVSYQLQVDLKGDLEYRVKLLTPISRAFLPSGEVILRKKLVRERTERVVVKRQVALPSS